MRNAVDNCLWADLGDGVVVVDSLEDRSMCPIIPEDIEATSGSRMRWLVNTHADTDHITCNGAWADMGATVIAHEKVREAMGERHGRPEITFEDRYTIEGSHRDAQLEWVGGAHTAADTLVYFPWARVLHVGDLFLWGLLPMARVTDERTARLCEVMERILSYDADILVCGHGPVFTRDHIRRWLTYFEELRQRVPLLARQGMSADAIAAVFPPPDDMSDWWRFSEWKHRRNIDVLLRET
jgi:glyoxylase-like metal-dependent hydrolase (beta-lactamase superfamily II)